MSQPLLPAIHHKICGFRLTEEMKVEGTSCWRCGARLQVGFKFCQTCGAPVKARHQRWLTLVLSQSRPLGQRILEAAQDKRLLMAAGSLILLVGLGIGGWYVYEQYFQGRNITSGDTGKATSGGESGGAPSLFVLTVMSSPPHCEVLLDGQRRGQTDTRGRLVLRNLPEGRHTISLRREGYYEWSQDVDLRFSMDLPVQLTPLPPVTLTVMTTLPDCTVYLDNQEVATTDASGQAVIPNVRQGQHSVRVSREGYEDWSQSITLQADRMLNATLRRLPYERRWQIARNHTNAGRRDRALNLLSELAAEEPNRPEAYELMGQIHYLQNDFSQAHQILGRAIERGGQAEFPVTHDHLGGLDPVDRQNREWRDYCNGTLIITNGTLQFRGGQPGEEFTVGRTEIREANMNQWVGVEMAAFNIKIRTGGRVRNFNFAPRTKQSAESQMILALISTYVR
ncbi:MAG: PEGA domain-containing protein [candidate division WOR-3 bacterium]